MSHLISYHSLRAEIAVFAVLSWKTAVGRRRRRWTYSTMPSMSMGRAGMRGGPIVHQAVLKVVHQARPVQVRQAASPATKPGSCGGRRRRRVRKCWVHLQSGNFKVEDVGWWSGGGGDLVDPVWYLLMIMLWYSWWSWMKSVVYAKIAYGSMDHTWWYVDHGNEQADHTWCIA